jgi:hypothetical protein
LAYDQARRFPLCNPEALGELFYGACIKQVKVCALDVITRFTSFDDYWQPFLRGQGSAPNYLTTRNHATNNAIRERLRRSLTTDPESAIELPAPSRERSAGGGEQLAEKHRNQRLGLERARLQAAPYIVFKNLRHGWEAVPLQEFNAQDFSASGEAVGNSLLVRQQCSRESLRRT